MAFTGAPVVKKITDNLFRITGVSLAAGAAGTVGLAGSAGGGNPEAVLTGANWDDYKGQLEAVIDLQESMQVAISPITDVSNFAIPIRVVKTAAGLITLTNDEAAVASPELEIYVRYH